MTFGSLAVLARKRQPCIGAKMRHASEGVSMQRNWMPGQGRNRKLGIHIQTLHTSSIFGFEAPIRRNSISRAQRWLIFSFPLCSTLLFYHEVMHALRERKTCPGRQLRLKNRKIPIVSFGVFTVMSTARCRETNQEVTGQAASSSASYPVTR